MSSGSSFTVRDAGAGFGPAVAEGLVPADLTDGAASRALCAALWTNGLVCVRLDGALSELETRGLAEMIGPIKDPVGRTRSGAELRYGEERQIVDAGFVLTDDVRAELGDLSFGGDSLRPGLFETFHTDDTFTERPALATVLFARELPASPGGDTCFMDMRAAYQLLDEPTRARLDGLRCVYRYDNGGAFPVGEPRNFWRYMIEGPTPAALRARTD